MNRSEEVLRMDASYRRVVDILVEAGHKVLNIIPINQDRYRIIKTDQGNFLAIYKKEPFYSFGKIFKNEGESGVGETVNYADLKSAVSQGVVRIFLMYPNGVIYSISMTDFITYAHKRFTDNENKEVRSISLSKFRRIEG